MDTDTHYLYMSYNDKNELLYIGISGRWSERLHQHEKTSLWMQETDWVKILKFSNREAVEEAEKRAIEALRPPYNRQYNGAFEDVHKHFKKLRHYVTNLESDETHRALILGMAKDAEALRPLMPKLRATDVAFLFHENYDYLTANKHLSCRNCLAVAGHSMYARMASQFADKFDDELGEMGQQWR